jgi:prophage regulatory protein
MKLLSMDELKSVKGISYSRPHLFRLIKSGHFPTPIKIGENRNAWTEEEIDAWVTKRIAERDALRKAS